MKILTTPNPILTREAKEVGKISAKASQRRPASGMGGPASGWDKKILKIIEDLKKTLVATENPKGVGLAAPQIGEPYQIFITRPLPTSSKIQVFINPKIVWASKELTQGVPQRENKLEGCLSIPGVWGLVKRHQTIKLYYKTADGKPHTRKFSGFLSTIIQHEMDHLQGKLFTARVLEQKGKFYKISLDSQGKEALEEIKLP